MDTKIPPCHAMTSYVYGCGPCCEWNSRHSSLLGRMAEAMGHALHAHAGEWDAGKGRGERAVESRGLEGRQGTNLKR
jgi:hypothetical protein